MRNVKKNAASCGTLSQKVTALREFVLAACTTIKPDAKKQEGEEGKEGEQLRGGG